MMDFVVSKVAMSICALIVASVLGAFYGEELFVDGNDELERILTDFSATANSAALARSEGTAIWRLPFLSSGAIVSISVDELTFVAICGDKRAFLRSSSDVHTWTWDGTELNRSIVETLDRTAQSVRSSSGHAFEITTRLVPYENDQKLLTFVNYFV